MLTTKNNIDQVIDTIRKLHHTTVDQRLIDLTEYLTEFFQSIQSDQSDLFRCLTRLLREDSDRTALKIEFVQSQCFECLYQIFDDDEQHVLPILDFLIELLRNSENVQEKFRQFNGYEKFFSSLRFISSPSIDLVNRFLNLIVDRTICPEENSTTISIDSPLRLIDPQLTVSLIRWIPHLIDLKVQFRLISTIDEIVFNSLQNKIIACSNGISQALVELLITGKIDDEPLTKKIFSLIENLSRFSIDSQVVRGLLHLFERCENYRNWLLKLFLIVAKSTDPDRQLISSFFDLQRSNSGILLSTICRWPSVNCSHLSFHCWLKLNHEIHSFPFGERRQIYSFYSNTFGLECFLHSSSLVVTLMDQQELVYVELKDCEDLFDGHWHSLTVVHTAQRSSRFSSAFQNHFTCLLTIFIDGLMRKEVPDLKFISLINETFPWASVAAPSQRPKSSNVKTKNDSISTTLAKTIQPLAGFFSSKSRMRERSGLFSSSAITTDPNTQESLFGPSTCLHGQLVCVWLINETLDERLVQHLHTLGPDFCHYSRPSQSTDDLDSFSTTIFDLVSSRSLFLYHPLACHGQTCLDISGGPSPLDARLINSSTLRLHSFAQSLLNLGGCSTLFPLLQIDENDENLNPVVLIVDLLRAVFSSISTANLSSELIENSTIEIFAIYLEEIPRKFLDEYFFLSLQQLIEFSRSFDSSHFFTNQLTEHLLLNFAIWKKTSFELRLSHLDFVIEQIKNDKKFLRSSFGVQFFLEILHEHFSLLEEYPDEQKQCREKIYSILKSLLELQLKSEDFDAIFSIISIADDWIIHELLDFLYSLFEFPTSMVDEILLLLSQSNQLELLYSLLTIRSLSNEAKMSVFKLINYVIGSPMISQDARARLKLETNHIGFGGIISCLALNDLNPSMVEEIFQLIFSSHSAPVVLHLNTFLTLCSAASLDVRCVAVRRVMRYFLSHPTVCRFYAKCQGWQETLAHFFVRTRHSNNARLSEFISRHSSSTDLSSYQLCTGLTSNSFNETINHDEVFDLDVDETIITPPQSARPSREDILSELKSERRKTIPEILIEDLEDRKNLEEMCETLILAIVMIFWKGIDNSDETAWTSRGQIFAALRHLHREYQFYLPLDYIERRLLELSIESCLNDIKLDGGKQNSSHEYNCRELIKLVHDFLCQSSDWNNRLNENFIEGILAILDTILISQKMKTSTSSHDFDSETSLTALNILLMLLSHPNISIYSQASIRLHSLFDHRPINGREEAAYLLSTVNQIFASISQTEQAERFAYLLPLLTVIIDESYDLLEMNVQISNISLHKTRPNPSNNLRQFVLATDNGEWHRFIQEITETYADHYRSMILRPFQMNMKIWWNHCHELTLIAVQKRNRQIAVEKTKFQEFIVEPWSERTQLAEQRRTSSIEQRRIHQIRLDRQWNCRMKYFSGERGPWFSSSNPIEPRWMLSDRENSHRMRCKLIENENFNLHEESSRLRDNQKVEANSTFVKTTTTEKDFSRRRRRSSEPDLSKYLHSFLIEKSEQIIVTRKCFLITSTLSTEGQFVVTDKFFYFFDLNISNGCQNDLKYSLNWLEDIQFRRFNLRPTALEFFLINRRNFLFNFSSEQRRKEIFQGILSLKLPSLKLIGANSNSIVTPGEILKELKLTERWMTREMSNFDYLMMLNTIAGRTYNDLNQYPIFPWILKDFTSNILDMRDPNVFRDFSKPIGIQNSKHINEVKMKYESFEDPTGLVNKFHYGTHYSNAASVMHYLIRMEPFTTLHIHLQGGKFDIADRQFHSLQSAWGNILDSPNDGKELIPEFFYLPEFLLNSNQFDLGKLQSSNQFLNDVELPPWSNQSAEEFIRIHRLALESDFVSANLHQWIDLIFGYKQSGQEAIDALNVYMFCSYEQVMETDDIDDLITRDAIDGMIQNFGQNPAQIFTEPHPQRQTTQQAALQMEAQGRVLNIFQNLNHVRAFFVELSLAHEKTPVIFMSIPKNSTRTFLQQATSETFVTINARGIVGNNGWLPFDKTSKYRFTIERDPTLSAEKNRLTTLLPFSPSITLTSRLFAVSHDAKWIFSGGHWDWSLQIYSLVKAKVVGSFLQHTDVITCLALDTTGYILVTGSRDQTCVIWNLSLNEQESSPMISSETTLYGHTAEISCVAVSSELDLVVSGSVDGTCNLYTIEDGMYVRTLRPTSDRLNPVINLKLSDERNILIQTEKEEETHLFLYSINGELIRLRKFIYRVVDFLISDQYLILAVNHSSTPAEKTAGSTEFARIIIKDMFEMTTIRTIRIRTIIHCLYLTRDLGHLLIAVNDGKLFVLTPDKRNGKKLISQASLH